MSISEEILHQPLCRLDELVDGQSRGFDPLGEGRDTMFVVRRGSQFFGYRNECPHYNFARMAWKKDEFLNADGTSIRCSAHGALFRIADGLCEAGPCVGERLTPVGLKARDGLLWLVKAYEPGRYLTTKRASQGGKCDKLT